MRERHWRCFSIQIKAFQLICFQLSRNEMFIKSRDLTLKTNQNAVFVERSFCSSKYLKRPANILDSGQTQLS